jgi:hypothetical protein
MKRLGGAICRLIVEEHGRRELLRRLADPFFFQSLGCVLGYDWHSSGLTTVTVGALKEGIKPEELGIAVCGGKGRTSRRTPEELARVGELFSLSDSKVLELQRTSRLVAKIDNACVQDGYQLYHHAFIVSEDGEWTVIQQGMHGTWARRYHWFSGLVHDPVNEPHSGIAGDRVEERVLDMTARESEEARRVSVDLVRESPRRLERHVRGAWQRTLEDYLSGSDPAVRLLMPERHTIPELTERTLRALRRAHELQPRDYRELVSIQGIGPRAIRALALVSEIVYGKPPSWRDPVRYTFAHGGKDGTPYPVDRRTYQKTIEILEDAIREMQAGREEKIRALRRLHEFLE